MSAYNPLAAPDDWPVGVMWENPDAPFRACPRCLTPRRMNHGCAGCVRRTLPGRVTRWARYRWHWYDGPARINSVAVLWPDGRRADTDVPCVTDRRAAESRALAVTR